jgi:hypothetical protein
MKLTESLLRRLIKEALDLAKVTDLERRLDAFDWYYQYSDDFRIYSKYHAEYGVMSAIADGLSRTEEGAAALQDMLGRLDPKSPAANFVQFYIKREK